MGMQHKLARLCDAQACLMIDAEHGRYAAVQPCAGCDDARCVKSGCYAPANETGKAACDGGSIGCESACEAHLVLCADGGPDDELVDVVELVPVLIARVHVPEQGLELGPAGNAHVERLGGDEGVGVEQVEVVQVCEVAQQLACMCQHVFKVYHVTADLQSPHSRTAARAPCT